MSVRKFPMPVWPNRGAGWCRWCGEATETSRRTWHSECVQTYKLHTWPAVQIAFLKKRDGNRCWDCGASPEKWIGRGPTYKPWSQDHVGPYSSLERVGALELEHETPLWKTTHLPDEERRRFFGPENLRLRCRGCHKAKSARESADRAKVKRIIRKSDPETRKPSTLKGRGFDKTLRKRFNGKVERR